VRNGSVCHLEIRKGEIEAIVSGSELYRIKVEITSLQAAKWKSLKQRCTGKIGSLIELLQGRLSEEIMEVVVDRSNGLFPLPGEIKYTCDCPDWAGMCKHIAAVMYGIGARLDSRPELLFALRGVDHQELISAGAASGTIAGSGLEEARDLALVLRAGALPARVSIIEERTVGPSLGRDSIDQGRIAGVVGIVLVVIVMMLYYGMAGVLAVAALAVYVLLVLGGLAGINATLTVPGIAGLILSIGMAVDANVLICERIREELAAGRATRTAVDEGFANALSAIVDANITTLITALILFNFGTGPVRGFAVTLSIGIVASFFSALFVTRSFFLVYLSRKKASDPISI
jgi:protein-export SecD/SecF family membrane protein